MNELNKIKRLHDTIKEHPFWLTHDMHYFKSLLNLFYDLPTTSSCRELKDTPYYMMLDVTVHDVRAMIGHNLFRIEEGKDIENLGNIILVLQTYLSNIHGLFEQRAGKVVGYTLDMGKYGIIRYQYFITDEHPNGIVLNVIPKKSLAGLKKIADRYISKPLYEEGKEFGMRMLKDIEDNKQIIADHWYIED